MSDRWASGGFTSIAAIDDFINHVDLIVHGEHEMSFPLVLARRLHRDVPGSQLSRVPFLGPSISTWPYSCGVPAL